MLEEYEHAKKRGAKIYAEIRGYGNTCDAYHITAPHPEAIGGCKAILDAMSEAGATGDERIYINAHGTSTPLNDVTETRAIKALFGEQAYSIPVSSTKSTHGHLLGATGALEAVLSVKVLQEGLLPPTMNLEHPDEQCDLDYVPNQARRAAIRSVLSNSFGFGGHNACLVFTQL